MAFDKPVSRRAPKGKFRVVGVSTFDGIDWLSGDFKTLKQAKRYADMQGRQGTKMHVYNHKGKHVYEAGTF